jgi:hypothetical protein
MSKIILSGDLSRFKPEMLLRILESVRADVMITLESTSSGQICVLQGKVCGAAMPPHRGIDALREIVPWNSGTFTVRDASGTMTAQLIRNPDIMAYPDNASLFRAMMGRRPGTAEGVVQPPGVAVPAGPAAAQAGVAAGARPATGPKIGPLARVPHLTDKGRATGRSLQANFQRGMAVDGDKWRLLLKCNGELTLFQIGEELQIMGERLLKSVKELQEDSLITFDNLDSSTASRLSGNFKFGEYMIARGHITQVQLEAALQRQQELARKGRYMWLGEILVEMNYLRPSQVQEALAFQKRKKS